MSPSKTEDSHGGHLGPVDATRVRQPMLGPGGRHQSSTVGTSADEGPPGPGQPKFGPGWRHQGGPAATSGTSGPVAATR